MPTDFAAYTIAEESSKNEELLRHRRAPRHRHRHHVDLFCVGGETQISVEPKNQRRCDFNV